MLSKREQEGPLSPPGGPSPAGCVGRAWCRVLGESAQRWCLPLSHTVCVWWLAVCLVYAGVHWCMLRGWLAHVLLSLAMWSGVVYGWLAVWLAVYMSVALWLAVCMALWLAGSLALLETKAIFAGKFQLLFSAFSASKSPQNPLKIAAKSAEIFADFSPILALQKPKPKNPKPKISIKNPKKENPKKKTQNLKNDPPKPRFDGG